ETFRRNIRDSMTVQLRSAADLNLFHCGSAPTRWANWHFRKDDGPAFPAPVAKQAGRGDSLSWNTKIARIENLHARTAKIRRRDAFSARESRHRKRERGTARLLLLFRAQFRIARTIRRVCSTYR